MFITRFNANCAKLCTYWYVLLSQTNNTCKTTPFDQLLDYPHANKQLSLNSLHGITGCAKFVAYQHEMRTIPANVTIIRFV